MIEHEGIYHNCQNRGNCENLCCTKIENLSVNIGSKQILKNIKLHIHCGELTAIIGPNGAGKSTLLKALIGDIKHNGNISFYKYNGKNTISPIIGYVPQNPNFDTTSPVSVLDIFVACTSKYPAFLPLPKETKNNIKKALNLVEAENLINQKIGVLSGGELQRVLLALALLPIPQILLLDEPVSGIDKKGLEMFYEILNKIRKEYDLSIVIVSHDLKLVEMYADRVLLLNTEVVKIGKPNEVLLSSEFISIYGNI